MSDKASLDAVSSHVDLIVRLQGSVRTLIASFVSFGALMLVSFWKFPQWVQILATVGFVACGSVLIVLLGDFLRIRWIRLKRLSGDEKEALNCFIRNNKKTVHWIATDDLPMSLAAEGIILPVRNLPSGPSEGYAWYTIKSWIFDYLSDHRDLIELSTNTST